MFKMRKVLALVTLAALPSLADQQPHFDGPAFSSEVASVVSAYVPASVYAQLTASVAAAAASASVTGDPGSLFLSAIAATPPPAWFSSAVPSYFSSNIAALEAAVSGLHSSAIGPTPTASPLSPSSSQTTIVTATTNSQGSTITTSYTSAVPISPSKTSSSTGAAAAVATAGAHQLAWAALAYLAVVF